VLGDVLLKNMFLPVVLLLALSGVPAMAGDGNDQGGGGNNNNQEEAFAESQVSRR
jgi:hypothetical protein